MARPATKHPSTSLWGSWRIISLKERIMYCFGPWGAILNGHQTRAWSPASPYLMHGEKKSGKSNETTGSIMVGDNFAFNDVTASRLKFPYKRYRERPRNGVAGLVLAHWLTRGPLNPPFIRKNWTILCHFSFECQSSGECSDSLNDSHLRVF